MLTEVAIGAVVEHDGLKEERSPQETNGTSPAEISRPDLPSAAAGDPDSVDMEKDDTLAANGVDESMPSSQPKHKKKGTASVMKKAPKKTKPGTKGARKGKTDKSETTLESDEEESDHGPYCICRGPDDHRWMIQCDQCEDWFHGECVKLDKELGENLVEKFVCPNCTDLRQGFVTRYKKMCSLDKCKKPARIYSKKDQSVFCSADHCQQWWEQQISRLPRRGSGGANSWDTLTQEDFMGLLNSDLASLVGVDGKWKMEVRPFKSASGRKRTCDDGRYYKDTRRKFQLTCISSRSSTFSGLGKGSYERRDRYSSKVGVRKAVDIGGEGTLRVHEQTPRPSLETTTRSSRSKENRKRHVRVRLQTRHGRSEAPICGLDEDSRGDGHLPDPKPR
jgi:PHD-finger